MKTKYIAKYLYGLLILFLTTACSSEEVNLSIKDSSSNATISDGKVTVDISILTSDMSQIQTRSLTGEPNLDKLVLYLVEFDDYGDALRNTLKTTYKPEIVSIENGRVKFKAVLNQTSQSRILHLIAIPDDNLKIEYGVEASIFSSLTVNNATPAYWRRLTFPNGYAREVSPEKFEPTEEIKNLTNVALIRNFACVTVQNDPATSGFTLTGFAIINNPSSGSVAPWNSATYSFPSLLKADQTMNSYSEIVKDYTGYVPASLAFTNPESSPAVPDDTNPKYLYERPFNSIRHTYVMIKGKVAGDDREYFYKLDIGKADDQKIFRYMHIIRNFRYNIILKSIDPNAKGYTSALAAAQGVVYNNFSFDIELSNMLNLSDGKDVVFVNFTTSVLTDTNPQQLVFKYRYRNVSDAGGSGPTFNNDDVTFIGLDGDNIPGAVINNVTFSNDNDSEGWRSVTLDCDGAGPITKTQSFTIVNENGLGRTINLILHRKWDLSYIYEIPGTLENWNRQDLINAGINPNSNSGAGDVPDGIGEELTIFFDIPDNLEEVMFPLVFTLEANRQNIENNPIGALVVTSGTSTFSGVQGRRIQYQKSVTWTQYNEPLNETDVDDNATAIKNPDGTTTHRIRCRFRTTTQLSDLPFNESQTTVRITNPNFNSFDITFNRKQGQ